MIVLTNEEEEKIMNRFGNDLPKLRAEFFTAVQRKNSNRVIALLRLLAQKDDFGKFLKDDIKLN